MTNSERLIEFLNNNKTTNRDDLMSRLNIGKAQMSILLRGLRNAHCIYCFGQHIEVIKKIKSVPSARCVEKAVSGRKEYALGKIDRVLKNEKLFRNLESIEQIYYLRKNGTLEVNQMLLRSMGDNWSRRYDKILEELCEKGYISKSKNGYTLDYEIPIWLYNIPKFIPKEVNDKPSGYIERFANTFEWIKDRTEKATLIKVLQEAEECFG